MGLERLQSIFNNIEDNKQSLDDGIPVESISNSVNDDIHSFGTQGNRTELIEITKISKKQSPSPLMAINGIFTEEGTITPINSVNGHNFKQIRINDNAGTNLLKTVNNEHGFGEVVSSIPDVSSINIGTTKTFTFDSLFAHNHAKPPNRPINTSLPGSLRSDLQLYIEPKNNQNLNIKSHSPNIGASRNGAFGFIKEPYITHNIPESGGAVGGIKPGYNRDGFPVRARLEDITRLGAFYSSNKGLLSLAAENITNLAIGDGFTLAEPFGALLYPAFPIPMTGFLNNFQQSKQGKFQGIEFPGKVKEVLKKGIRGYGFDLKDIPGGNTVSIRKPGVYEYSEMFNQLSKRPFIAGLHGDADPFLNTDFTNPIKLQIKQDVAAKRIDYKIKKQQGAFSARRDDGTPGNLPLTKKQQVQNFGATAGNGIIGGLNKGLSGLNKLENLARKAAQAAVDVAHDEFEKLANQGVALPQNPTANFLGLGKNTERISGKFTNYDDVFTRSGPRTSELDADKIQDGDFYVRITDERKGGQFLYFRGFVTGITENVTPTWNPTQYVGRSEDVYIYQKGERDLSFNLRVAPQNSIDLESMYQKMNILTSLAYPYYLPETSLRMQPPFSTLYMAHIGSKATGQFGFIKSITYTVNEQGDWDALTQLPRVFDIALSFQILNKKPPQAWPHTKYYDLKPDDVEITDDNWASFD